MWIFGSILALLWLLFVFYGACCVCAYHATLHIRQSHSHCFDFVVSNSQAVARACFGDSMVAGRTQMCCLSACPCSNQDA
jgi:hypothetical protein